VCLGLKKAKEAIVNRLSSHGPSIFHETDRLGGIDDKNFLATGDITLVEVIELINKTKGHEFSESEHHHIKGVMIYEFKSNGGQWYIKCYLIEPDVWFISVHR
jgi:hypothetical protein